MVNFNFIIRDELGIHARPAGEIAKLAKKFDSKVIIKNGEKEAEATRLMAVMGLCIKNGAEVEIKVEGPDEVEACNAVKEFFDNNL